MARRQSHDELCSCHPGVGVSRVVVEGRKALAKLLRLIADQVEEGSIDHPFSIQPAPHLGPFVVRVGGIDYDMAAELPGVIPDDEDDDALDTLPGKGLAR